MPVFYDKLRAKCILKLYFSLHTYSKNGYNRIKFPEEKKEHKNCLYILLWFFFLLCVLTYLFRFWFWFVQNKKTKSWYYLVSLTRVTMKLVRSISSINQERYSCIFPKTTDAINNNESSITICYIFLISVNLRPQILFSNLFFGWIAIPGFSRKVDKLLSHILTFFILVFHIWLPES